MATKSNRSSGTQINARGIAQGTTLVDPKSGYPIDVIVDTDGVRRLAVDTVINLDATGLNVDLDPTEDGVYIANQAGDALLINPDGSINVNTNVDAAGGDNIAISGHSSPVFDEAADVLTDLSYKKIFEYTSSNSSTKIIKLECTCETVANFRVKIGTDIIKVLRSSPIERNIVFKFEEHRPLPNASVISVEAQIERQFSPSYETFVSMEGYIG